MELVEIHLITLVCTALIILYSDHQGFLYFRGKKKVLSESFLNWSHRLVWSGLLLMIASGVLLTIPSYEYRLTQPLFYVKMGFVLVLLFNAFAIGTLSKLASTRPFADLSIDEKRTLLLSGGLSALSWLGAFTIGILFL